MGDRSGKYPSPPEGGRRVMRLTGRVCRPGTVFHTVRSITAAPVILSRWSVGSMQGTSSSNGHRGIRRRPCRFPP